MFIRKSEYEELKAKLESARSDASHYERMYETYENNYKKEHNKNDALNTENAKLREQIEDLERQIDILHQYYRLDDEPTQEEKTKMRIDMRVHDLEMENLSLRATVNASIISLKADLNRAMMSISNSSFLPMYNAASINHYSFIPSYNC